MKIGLMHFRVGETDGVSLEMFKWKAVLEKMGHEVFLIGGETGNLKALKVPSISYRNKINIEIKNHAYISLDDWGVEDLIRKNEAYYSTILRELLKLPEMDVIFVNNIFSLGHNLSAAKAVYEFAKIKKIKLIGHHHDFYWERDFYSNPTTDYVAYYLENFFPPKDINHVVINSIARDSLQNYKGINSTIVPNVFDFSNDLWKRDSYNSKIIDKFNLKENDLIFLQATRIVQRKAIELAIDTLSKVVEEIHLYNRNVIYNGKKIDENSKIYLVLPGLNEEEAYTEKLVKYANKKNVDMILAEEMCEDERNESEGIFSLWDFYAISDFVTYPSVKEGFGNQFLEAVFAKKPILVFNYPVYDVDIEPLGFKTISLGNKTEKKEDFYMIPDDIITSASKEILEVLFNREKAYDYIETNFKLAKKHFSYNSLEEKLREILKSI
ncbi:glycosyltransferase family 4 protein [Geotoga petraea]|jgi:glycosyltransferase involved in cell wall biosynthesis|uniref:Glycosyltransferase n=1 Tax=Geotoga petraea TaxID=28234 RepID=A0A1G6PUS8_9BACT|nr:glycosyltransferase family 4 protein [Geotoga petraea]MDK2946375.1 mannosylglucosylglycerate synthase [Geotoga sp.]TGG86863.1 glycosyltransferase [Geotoga petraea]SDC83839.1 Glycosyltransferase involved in cell wall bisynthesis [Geotoga petraea]